MASNALMALLGALPSNPSPKGETDEEVLNNVGQSYPRLKKYLSQTAIKKSPSEDDRQLEYYAPWEEENPTPGKIMLEIFNPELKGKELSESVALDMLHYLGSKNPKGEAVDPEYYKLKSSMRDAIQKADRPMDKEAYWEERKAGMAGPSYNDWLEHNRTDAYIRGYVSPEMNPEWHPDIYTTDMRKIGNSIKQFLSQSGEE